MSALLRLPALFFEDHESRDLPTPTVVKRTSRYVFVERDDEHLAELRSDADYYSDPTGFDPWVGRRLTPSARATVRAIDRAKAEGGAR